MTARITKSRDPILAALKASFGEAVNAMCKTVEVDDYVRAIEECAAADDIPAQGRRLGNSGSLRAGGLPPSRGPYPRYPLFL